MAYDRVGERLVMFGGRYYSSSVGTVVVNTTSAFAPGIAGVDDRVDIGALQQAFNQVESRLRLLDRLEGEAIRNDWKIGKAPFAALLVHLSGEAKLNQVTNGGSDDKVIILKDVVLLRNFSESAREVGRDARLFRNNESFRHLIGFLQNGYRAIA